MWKALLLAAVAIIPPGHEQEIGSLFQGLALPSGCSVGDVRIDSDRILARLSCEGGRTPTLELVHPSRAPQAPRTAHFAVLVRGDAPEGLDRAAAAALAARDTSSPWNAPEEPASPRLPRPASITIALLLAAWPLSELVRIIRARRPA